MSIFHLRVHPPPQQKDSRSAYCIFKCTSPHSLRKAPHMFILHLLPASPQSSRCPRCFRVTVVAPFCDHLGAQEREEGNSPSHTCAQTNDVGEEATQKNGPHSPQRQALLLKRTYCSLCQGEVVVEKAIHFYTSLLLKRNYPKENFCYKMGHWVDSGGRMLLGRGGPLNYSTQ